VKMTLWHCYTSHTYDTTSQHHSGRSLWRWHNDTATHHIRMIRHLNTTVDARCEDDMMTLLHITYISYRQLNW